MSPIDTASAVAHPGVSASACSAGMAALSQQDSSLASRALSNRLCAAVQPSADSGTPGIDGAAIRLVGTCQGVGLVAHANSGDR